MLSRILPLEDLAQRSIMYWLPPGGQDNGVWVNTWVIVAELEAPEVVPILNRMADADVGAYAARPGRGSTGHLLYADVMQYNQALDVLMVFLRGKGSPDTRPTSARPRRASTPDDARSRHVAARRPAATPLARTAIRTLQWVLAVAFVALTLVLMYHVGSVRFPVLHPATQHSQTP